ncbi:MAG: efflux RND transporter periplasmic adaptor subunit [Anaerolineae bacterium]|nr:efflux RND transporter periplasmic adaptor subunit [Anaerolineae bacterium]MBT3712139.1 efflux RND transporter periplasmic adaptor subunit [Anaerolineae bacterium]MBT4311354.1 efflux RND transporter periplasmic adaptor subunit [Anaerolineae bacterium]MBT4459588.1 efflux RND transporter periplasmic adaptor subunit [Anaerolineae bacterium]MBT4841655.1 efflux RND transporter periplasmic adaptor subunit [Anaerolineae bacterium]
MKRTLIIIAVVIVIAAGAFFVVRNNANNKVGSEYRTEKIERGNLTATVGATGTVRSNQNALLSWQTTGTVEVVNVSVGDRVSEDLTLASLESTSLSQSIILAQADIVSAEKALTDLLQSGTAEAQARVDLRKADEVLETAQNYRDSLDEPYKYEKIVYTVINGSRVPTLKTVSVDEADDETKEEAEQDLALKQAQYDDALRAWERVADGVNEADVNAAQARVDAAQATLNLASLSAPFEGTVTQVDIMGGDQVSAGTLAFRVDDFSKLLVDVELSEIDINSVELGQLVSLSFDAILDKEYQGKVIEVGRIGKDVQGVINFTVTVELSDADDLVRPGMTAAVNIVVKEIENVLLIPNKAVRLVDGDRAIYLLKDDFPEMVEVRLGASADGMSVLVSDNIEEGAQVILNPPSEASFGDGPPGGRPGGN